MDYFFFNTDATSMGGKRRFPIMIEKDFAATSGPLKFGDQLGKLAPDDVLLMYQNGLGVVAVGTVLEKWDGKAHQDPLYFESTDSGFDHEYRIKVDWFLDLSTDPVGISELKEQIGSTPRGAIRKIVKSRAEIEQLIDERKKGLGRSEGTNEIKRSSQTTTINSFFTETLGANLRNPRWSWGAVEPITNRVFLRVWEDSIESTPNGERVGVAWDDPKRFSNGAAERQSHLELIQNESEGFGVVCTAVDPNTSEARKIATFDQSLLLRLGSVAKENGQTYASIVGRVPVEVVIRQQTAQSTLVDDLKAIFNQKVETTVKQTLVDARVGQGKFRTQVMKLWGNCCAVTGSVTSDALRASHIQPWSESTNEVRLDPNNGLPLIANLDALFDAGLISFESSGEMIISRCLSDSERILFQIDHKSLSKHPTAQTAAFLAYHREHRFKK